MYVCNENEWSTCWCGGKCSVLWYEWVLFGMYECMPPSSRRKIVLRDSIREVTLYRGNFLGGIFGDFRALLGVFSFFLHVCVYTRTRAHAHAHARAHARGNRKFLELLEKFELFEKLQQFQQFKQFVQFRNNSRKLCVLYI